MSTRVVVLLPFLVASMFVGLICLAVHRSNVAPYISQYVNRVALVPVGADEFVLVADERYRIKASADSSIRVQPVQFSEDSYTERIATCTAAATTGVVAAWRRDVSSSFVGVFDVTAASHPELLWKVDLAEGTVVEAIAVTEDGMHLAMVVDGLRSQGRHVVVATNGGKQTDLPVTGTSSLVWYKDSVGWHLAINELASGISHYDLTSDVIRFDEEGSTLSGQMIGSLCSHYVLIGDSQFDDRIGMNPEIIRIVSNAGGPATRHGVLQTGKWVPQAIITNCRGNDVAFMCRCLGQGRSSSIVLGIGKTNATTSPDAVQLPTAWKLYLRRSRDSIVALTNHRDRGCFVTHTDSGFLLETLPWDEAKLEELCRKGEIELIEQD